VVGRQMDLDDVLNDCRVPEDEELRREVVEDISCPGCGDSIDAWYEVGIRFNFEIEHERAIERAERRFGPGLRAFAAFLEQFPMLGASHPLGRRILREIGDFPKRLLEQATWYRARRIESGREFFSEDMRLPERDSVLSPGRFNHLGQAHWYLASSADTAACEVLDKGEKIVWVQKWIVGPIEPILDLVRFGADDAEPVTDVRAKDLPLLAAAMIFGGHLNRPADRKRGWRPEYFIPHYVSDAAKNAGFKGIRFDSRRGAGLNLVIFDSAASVTPDGKPELFNLETAFEDSAFEY
jgi:hypothetical protein